MRWSALILVVVLGAVGAPGRADAEKVKTNQAAKLYSHPGEAGTVLLKIKSGQAMTLLNKDGRWLKVRVNGLTGYIPRSKCDMPDADDEIGRNTRRRPFVDGRGTTRGFGGEQGPDDRIGKDATGQSGPDPSDGGDDGDDGSKPPGKTKPVKVKPDKVDKGKGKPKPEEDEPDDVPPDKGDGGDGDGGESKADSRPVVHVTESAKVYEEPKKSSAVAFKAKPDSKLFVEDTKGKWTEVSMEEGEIGWVLTSQLDLEEAGIGTNAITKRDIQLRVRAGFSFINEGLRTTGDTTIGPPDNYNVASAAATLALGGQYLVPYKKDYIVGGELAYDFSKAYPGVAYMGTNIGISMHNLTLRGDAGYDLHKSNGMTLFARLGYKYESFLVPTTNNAKIPSEVFKSPTIGAALWIPRITPTIGARASLDAAVVGTSITQTKNLEDGVGAVARGVDVQLQFTYRWKPNMDLQATYDLNYAGVNFGAPLTTSQNMHTGTDVTRTDIFHTVTAGVTRSF